MLEKWLNTLNVMREELSGTATDKFLEILLKGMESAFKVDSIFFWLLKGYRQNIRDFSGCYVFNTRDGKVAASAVFQNGDMMVHEKALDRWDVRVTFENAQALRGFIFSRDQDIVNSLLKNEVELDGNLNYIYKFGFMARDLGHRLGVV